MFPKFKLKKLPGNVFINEPSNGSYTNTLLPDATINCEPSGRKQISFILKINNLFIYLFIIIKLIRKFNRTFVRLDLYQLLFQSSSQLLSYFKKILNFNQNKMRLFTI